MTGESSPVTSDALEHTDRLRQLPHHSDPSLRTFFARHSPIFVARAPGRLDVMGGIADYSGSLVLELPIAEASFASVQRTSDTGIRVASLSPGKVRMANLMSPQWSTLLAADYSTISKALIQETGATWAAYVIGPVLTLLRESKTRLAEGLRILIDSQVPEGKGVSSSAAVEVATMRAVAVALDIEIAGNELAQWCQLAENRVAGAPCGIMDQMTSALGRENELLALRCQPALVEGFVPIPRDVAFWGIDSGIRHAVSGSDYASVRCGAFMGYRIIAELAGLRAISAKNDPGVFDVDDASWHGYLANITPDEFYGRFGSEVPERMSGRDFLMRYGGTTDCNTRVDPDRSYAIRPPTLHPIEENARVERFRALLQGSITEQALVEMGAIMAAAHASYSACGLGSDGTDLLVRLVRESGPASGLYGAKITGGGSGGTVAILGRANADPEIDRVAKRYYERTGRQAFVFRGSSPGACQTRVMQVRL